MSTWRQQQQSALNQGEPHCITCCMIQLIAVACNETASGCWSLQYWRLIWKCVHALNLDVSLQQYAQSVGSKWVMQLPHATTSCTCLQSLTLAHNTRAVLQCIVAQSHVLQSTCDAYMHNGLVCCKPALILPHTCLWAVHCFV